MLQVVLCDSWSQSVLPGAGSYNAINGVPDCLNGELLRDTLYKEWSMEVRT